MNTAKSQRGGGRVITLQMWWWYAFCKFWVQVVMTVFFRLRTFGVEHTEVKGGALIVANHQSYLDPPAIGCRIKGKVNYLAQKGLFRFKPFGKLIATLDAIPLEKNGIGFEGIKETLKRLKNGERVLIFPEGERTREPNGAMMPFHKAVVTLALRSKVPIIPAAIAGAFEAWPRGQKLPNLIPDSRNALRVIFGEPIPYEQAASMTDDELNDCVKQRVQELYEQIRGRCMR
ncbi:MAG: 1-acyl-sn-glycerol-3-phosphate acyltransferase [Planctomycetaceae bacterium]|nr:1-acyl-sn-glycerol-3-phosphate acyltransferase [Planctomycetaceae bacterium]